MALKDTSAGDRCVASIASGAGDVGETWHLWHQGLLRVEVTVVGQAADVACGVMMVSYPMDLNRPSRIWRRRRWRVRSIQGIIAMRRSSWVIQERRSSTFFCSRGKNDSMAALLPADPARTINPTMSCLASARWTFLARNWLPRSECRLQPAT